jgi:nitroimidazol reductase NimA-like FMN-containing flavoprotein (pyridoxamine 5'-phosphate oxidase superfamily)
MNLDDQERTWRRIQHMLQSQYFGVLATQGKEYPYCSLIGFAVSEDGKDILFATIRDTRKFANIQQSPNVSLLIDSQTNKVDDFMTAQALTAQGRAYEVPDEDRARWLGVFLGKHPYLKEFVTAPNCVLIHIQVAKYILVNNFQNVLEYNVSE